jgi:ribonucleotide monophosphatase NagD (HAD superfamily)
VLVLTGVTTAGDARIADTGPDLVVPSIRHLVT